MVHDPWFQDIIDYLPNVNPEYGTSPGEALNELGLDVHQQHKGASQRVGQLLRKAGWVKGRRDRKRGILYFPSSS